MHNGRVLLDGRREPSRINAILVTPQVVLIAFVPSPFLNAADQEMMVAPWGQPELHF